MSSINTPTDPTSAAYERWKAHRQLTFPVPAAELNFRGCLGLALILNSVNCNSWIVVPRGKSKSDTDDLTFVSDNTVSWASIVDVPVGYFVNYNMKRETHFASVRPTSLRYGMPCLLPGTETLQCDFRDSPCPDVHPDSITLDARKHPQLFRVFNAIEWAMTTTAFARRQSWNVGRKGVAESLGYAYDPKTPLLAFGDGVYNGIAEPHQWMPKPYIAFPVKLWDSVYERATRALGSLDTRPAYSNSLRTAFVDAVGEHLAYRATFSGRVESIERVHYRNIPILEFRLKGNRGEHETVRFAQSSCHVRKHTFTNFNAGDVIAEDGFRFDLPENWYDLTPAVRWGYCTHDIFLNRLDPTIRLWFERSGLRLKDGLVHFPAQMASVAALSSAVDGELFWEVSQCLEYFASDCDAAVFPTVPLHRWHHLSGSLPGDVYYDLTPNHGRFESYWDQRDRVERQQRDEEARREQEECQRAFAENVRRRHLSATSSPCLDDTVAAKHALQLSPAEQEAMRVAAIKDSLTPNWKKKKAKA